jgi:hypothetical protein
MIFTFYSYKGGVGRSMALANIAEWFYQQGARVLMVDWDLEAPGLESFFYKNEDDLKSIRAKEGLIDLLLEYRKLYALAARTGEGGDHDEIMSVATSRLKPLKDWLHTIHGAEPDDAIRRKGLWLLTAGRREGRFAEYAEAVHDFNWAELYDDYQGEQFFQWLRTLASPQFEGHRFVGRAFADVVLIDSRTGITEMGGVCTQELADVVVAFSAPNLQNLAGTEAMLRSFRRPEILEAREGKPEVIIVPSRVDASEIDSRNRFEHRLRSVENEFLPSILQSLKGSFWDLKIPYVPRFAYEEALTIQDPSGNARYIEATEMATAYRQLAASMAVLTPSAHPLRTYTLQDTTTLFEKKRVYLTWAGTGGTALAHSLRLKLEAEAPDIDLWLQQRDSSVPVAEAQATETIGASSSLLLALTPETFSSDWIRGNWQQARRSGTCVFVVYSGTVKPSLPVWLRKGQLFELHNDWGRLLQNLRSRCVALRAPFMAPALPASYVPPVGKLELLRTYFITESGGPQIARCVLHGMGGSGKSILAAALCHDVTVADAFDDGILWVSLGNKPDIREAVGQLYVALTGDRASFTSVQQAAFELGNKMAGLNCLIVLDDVWEPDSLQWFSQVAASSAMIMTTRNASISSDALSVHLGEMSTEEALKLLSYGINVADSSPLLEVADRLARLPLALSLARVVLLERIKQGESPERACQYLAQAVSRTGFQNFDDLGKSLARSLNVLSQQERGHFYLLAGFPEGGSIPVTQAAKLWAIEEMDAETEIQKFARLSILEFDPSQKTFLLHPAIRSYVESVAPPTEMSRRLKDVIVSSQQPVTLISVEPQRDAYRLSILGDGLVQNVRLPVNPPLLVALSSQLLQYETFPAQADAGSALFQLLFPKNFDQAVSWELPIVIRTRGAASQIPWEMLIPPNSDTPLGIKPGLSRAFPILPSPVVREEIGVRSLAALVIAPDYGRRPRFRGPPGGPEEAHQIADLLAAAGMRVSLLAGDRATATAVITNLRANFYDLIHFVGFHTANVADPAASGWLLDDFNLGVRELDKIFKTPPSLVFCDAIISEDDPSVSFVSDLPAITAEAFMNIGIANFVLQAAPAFDKAAVRFAFGLYRELIGGSTISAAMRHTREALRLSADGVTVWGKYQHYGDPSFRLPNNRSKLQFRTDESSGPQSFARGAGNR